jgi:hypothetical protein
VCTEKFPQTSRIRRLIFAPNVDIFLSNFLPEEFKKENAKAPKTLMLLVNLTNSQA